MNRLSVAFLKGQTLQNNTTHQEHMACMFIQLLLHGVLKQPTRSCSEMETVFSVLLPSSFSIATEE